LNTHENKFKPQRIEGALRMNPISNIWNHPKTSAAGLLIAVASIASVLSQQGVTLGTAGAGTIVSLIGALATALLGLLAKDPGSSSVSTGSTARLGAWALISLLLPLPFISGCTGVAVAQDIVNWTPALQGAVATVDTTASLLDPVAAPVFSAATIGFDAASNLLVSQARAYLANPSAGVLAQMQNQVVVFEQQVNTALLQAGKIDDQASQQHATAAIQAVGTIVSAILALVQSVSTKAAVAHMAAQAPIKMAAVKLYGNSAQAAAIVAAHYGEPLTQARLQVAQVEQEASSAGF
jgi:hypothetical protein